MLVTLNATADPKSRKIAARSQRARCEGLDRHRLVRAFGRRQQVAVSLSKNGSEDGTLHVYDVATGKEIG